MTSKTLKDPYIALMQRLTRDHGDNTAGAIDQVACTYAGDADPTVEQVLRAAERVIDKKAGFLSDRLDPEAAHLANKIEPKWGGCCSDLVVGKAHEVAKKRGDTKATVKDLQEAWTKHGKPYLREDGQIDMELPDKLAAAAPFVQKMVDWKSKIHSKAIPALNMFSSQYGDPVAHHMVELASAAALERGEMKATLRDLMQARALNASALLQKIDPSKLYRKKKAANILGRFERVPQPLKPRGEVKALKTLLPDEVLHRVMQSKNHQHHLNRLDPERKAHFLEEFKQKWVGDHVYHLADVSVDAIQNKAFQHNPEAVKGYVKKFPEDRQIILAPFPSDKTPHVVLDGNHLLAAARELRKPTIKAYVQEPLL